MMLIFLIFVYFLIIYKVVILGSSASTGSYYSNWTSGFITSKDVKKGRGCTITITLTTGRVITISGVANHDNLEVGDAVRVNENYTYNNYKRLLKKEIKFEKRWS